MTDIPFHMSVTVQDGRRFLHGNGCDAHPNCLTCPFVRCRFDVPISHQEFRDRTIKIALAARARGRKAAAVEFDISLRAVYRACARYDQLTEGAQP